jgi:DNA-binding MarR family transcriptional regulator
MGNRYLDPSERRLRLVLDAGFHNPRCVSASPVRLDLAQSVSLLGAWVDGHVVQRLRAAGLAGLRPGHGYFVQRLLEGPATATEMAHALGITQQAASKAVRELVDLGYVVLAADETDRRRKQAELTDKGREAVALARTARAELDARLRAVVGERRFATALGVLDQAMTELGLEEAVRARRVPPPADSS